MSNEAIDKNVFVREFTKEIHNRNFAIFAGAGLSVASGYVDWKGLLHELIEDLKLNPDEENDLVAIAQYHCNQAGGNRAALTKRIFDFFTQTKVPTENHKVLALLPIQTYWTTNYDKLIETALTAAKKVPDVKYTVDQLASTRLDRDVVVYKMHGDVEHPNKAVISKDDYETYPLKMGPFVSALRGDLISKTFLFLGFSFTDPNLDYILSRVRALYEKDQRHHYCIQKRVSPDKDELDAKFKIRELKQHYFIKDLKRFGIQTVLVDSYPEITDILREVSDRYKRRSIFISGAAHDFGAWGKDASESFLHDLSYKLVQSGTRVVTGFGLGVGGPVINGSLACLNNQDKTVTDNDIVMRPFPQVATGGKILAEQWTAYRIEMVGHAGIAIFVFGNKFDAGKIVTSNGMRQEFELAVRFGLKPLPVGATGYMAKELWDEVTSKFTDFFPDADIAFKDKFKELGDTSKKPNELIDALDALIKKLQRS